MATYDQHLNRDTAPDYAKHEFPINKFGSVTASSRLLFFKALRAYRFVDITVSPQTIASGTFEVDVLVNGVTVMLVKPYATAADTPIAGTFLSTAKIVTGDTVEVKTSAPSATVTDANGVLTLRPALGEERT
jgi:hypothetical protein